MQVAGGLPSFLRFFGKTFPDDPVQCRRSYRLQRRHGRRIGSKDRGNQAGVARGLKCLFTCCHLIHQCAESEEVGAGIDIVRSAFQLLRRHVLQCPHDHAVTRQGIIRRDKLREGPGGGLLAQLRQSEVEQLDPTPGEHDVGRFQITVRDTAPMRLIQSVGDLDRILQNLVERQGALR